MDIRTERLVLRQWREADRAPLAAMHADPEVMVDYGGPQDRAFSDAKFDRYRETIDRLGYGRWAVEEVGGELIGYVGAMPIWPDHPRAPGHEMGWRLVRRAWGKGYATEAARAAIADVFERIGLAEVVAYTGPENLRSQAVMARLGLERRADLDFVHGYEGRSFEGLVWRAERGCWA